MVNPYAKQIPEGVSNRAELIAVLTDFHFSAIALQSRAMKEDASAVKALAPIVLQDYSCAENNDPRLKACRASPFWGLGL